MSIFLPQVLLIQPFLLHQVIYIREVTLTAKNIVSCSHFTKKNREVCVEIRQEFLWLCPSIELLMQSSVEPFLYQLNSVVILVHEKSYGFTVTSRCLLVVSLVPTLPRIYCLQTILRLVSCPFLILIQWKQRIQESSPSLSPTQKDWMMLNLLLTWLVPVFQSLKHQSRHREVSCCFTVFCCVFWLSIFVVHLTFLEMLEVNAPALYAWDSCHWLLQPGY